MAVWGGEFTGSLGGEPGHRSVCPADLLGSTMSRSRVTEPKQVGAGTGWLACLRPTSATSGPILCTEEGCVGVLEEQ